MQVIWRWVRSMGRGGPHTRGEVGEAEERAARHEEGQEPEPHVKGVVDRGDGQQAPGVGEGHGVHGEPEGWSVQGIRVAGMAGGRHSPSQIEVLFHADSLSGKLAAANSASTRGEANLPGRKISLRRKQYE